MPEWPKVTSWGQIGMGYAQYPTSQEDIEQYLSDMDEEYNDEDDWDNFIYAVDQLFDWLTMGEGKYGPAICVDGGPLDWRGSYGFANIAPTTGHEFLRAILPNTDCHIRVQPELLTYENGTEVRQLLVRIAHHDVPMGGWVTATVLIDAPDEETPVYGDASRNTVIGTVFETYDPHAQGYEASLWMAGRPAGERLASDNCYIAYDYLPSGEVYWLLNQEHMPKVWGEY